MPVERCIPIKKLLMDSMKEKFPDFLFQNSSTSTLYGFTRKSSHGIYDHIILQRDFFDGVISLTISEVAACYNHSWRGIPWFTVGYDSDIAALITGKKQNTAGVGWHRCGNSKEEVELLLPAIQSDIETYVLPFLELSHQKIGSDRYMTTLQEYLTGQFAALTEEQITSIKQFLVDGNKVYSQYRKTCRENGQQETLHYYEVFPLHPMVEQWLNDLKEQLGYAELSRNQRLKMIGHTTVLFRDVFDFYNLK